MANPFEALISKEFKAIYNQAIDAILANTALSLPCVISYGSSNNILCNNCLYDPMSQRSLNKYNGTGPVSFPNSSICPVCNGYGLLDKANEETVYMAVLFDSKYWFNWSTKADAINIADGMVQTLCPISMLPKIKNAQYITIDKNIENYGGYTYVAAGDPQPCGLGDNRYIVTMWSRA
jgi:hypothetical protein